MSVPTRGKNAGVSGIVEIADQAGASAKFLCRIYKYSARMQGEARPRRGRGGGFYGTLRWTFSSGTVILSGKMELPSSNWPQPNAWRGQEGTITIQVGSGKTVAYPVKITEHGQSFDEKTEDTPSIMLTAQVIGAPTYAGWSGSQPTATEASKADQEQWQGTNKTFDPEVLGSSAIRLIDIFGTLTDSDAAEYTKLTTVAGAASAPFTGMKLRSATFARDALDGGTITEIWGLTDTRDDVEMPATVTNYDASELFETATICKVESDGTLIAPAAPVGQHIASDIRLLNDNRWRKVYYYGSLTKEQELEFAGATIEDDPKNLSDTDRQTIQNSSSTPPSVPATRIADLKHVRTISLHVGGTPEVWTHTFLFARRDGEDDVEMGGTQYVVDPSDLQSSASITIVESDSTPDGGVSVSGLVLRSTTKRQLHDSKWAITYNFAETTTEDDVEFAGTITIDDPDNIADSATVRIVNSSSTYPGALDTPPSGLKLRRVVTQQLTNGDKYQHTAEYGRRDTTDDVEQGGTVYQEDQSGNVVAGSARVTIVESDSTPDGGVTVSGLVLRFIEKKEIHDSKWEMTYVFGQNTPESDIEFDGTVYENSIGDLSDVARVTLINASSTYPGALDTPPSSPTTGTLKLRRIVSRQLTTAGRWAHTGLYGLNTETNDIEMGGSSVVDDQSDLADAQVIVVVSGSGTPSNPGTPSGLKYRDVVTRQLNDGKWRHEYQYARRNREDDIEMDGTFTVLDSLALESGGAIAIINTSATPPADPGTPVTDGVLFSTRTDQIHGAATPKYVHIFVYRMRTSVQDVTFAGTVLTTDAENGDADTTTTVETIATTLDALRDTFVTANIGSLTFDSVSARQLTATKAEVRLRTKSTTVRLIESTRTGYQTRASRAGAVMVSAFRQETATRWRARIIPQNIQVTSGIIRIRRPIVATSRPAIFSLADSTYYSGKVGLTNNALFLGFPIKGLMYLGWDEAQDYGREGTSHRIDIDFVFALDSIGHYNDEQIDTRAEFVFSNQSLTIGLNAASKFGWTVTEPATSDFSVFIA